MESIKSFIAEVLDVVDVDLTTDENVASFLSGGLLQYDAMFKCKRVIDNLGFCWVWKNIMGIYPSKLLLMSGGGSLSSFNSCVEFARINSFYRFVPKMDVAHDLEARYGAYMGQLTKGKAFIKSELFEKLRDRINPTWKASAESKTLFSLYSIMVADAYPYVAIDSRNPITGFIVPLPHYNKISRFDVLKWVYTNDNYFIRLMTSGLVFVSSVADGRLKKPLGGVALAIGTDSYVRGLCADSFVVDESVLIDACSVVPRLARHCVSFGETAPMLTKGGLRLLPDDRITDPNCFDMLASSRISTYVGGGQGAMPFDIQRLMVEMYCKVKDRVQFYRGCPNCVLLIDNRCNMLTVMAAFITFYNLKPNTWDLVIVTSQECKSFYEGYFPGAVFIISDLGGKFFNIETYNRFMKSADLWSKLGAYIKCLTVQDDGFIVRPGLEDNFMEYDYVGAPWLPGPHLVAVGIGSDFVGNGGLSLRDVSTMWDIASSCLDDKMVLFNSNMQPIPEDVYFSACVEKRGGRIPGKEEATGFAMEQIINMKALGMHKPWPYVGAQVGIEFLNKALNEIVIS